MTIVIHKNRIVLGEETSDIVVTRVALNVDEKIPVLVDFTVTQLLEWDIIYPVVRYDCSHGYLNVHHYYESKNRRMDYIHQKPTTKLYEECKKDVLENWRAYREKFIRHRLKPTPLN